MEITYWHRLAHLYQTKELELSEIAKVWIINTAVGVIKDNPDVTQIGINVLDNSQINNALVFGVLKEYPDGQLISYPEIGKMLNLHSQTIGKGVKQLIEDGLISKQDYGASGSTYETLKDPTPPYPEWIFRFTEAIVNISTDKDFHNKVEKDCENIKFQRGMEVLKNELRRKFYHRKKPKTDSN